MSLLLLFNSQPTGPGTVSGSFTSDSILLKTASAAFTADAILLSAVSGSFTADAVLLKPDNSATFTADAELFSPVVEATFTADAALVIVGTPHWTTPADNTQITSTPVLAFIIPQATAPMHFQIELDRVNTFDSVDLSTFDSNNDNTNWEYWDGDSWEPVPVGGVSQSFAGNEARLTISNPLATGEWFRRVRAGV